LSGRRGGRRRPDRQGPGRGAARLGRRSGQGNGLRLLGSEGRAVPHPRRPCARVPRRLDAELDRRLMRAAVLTLVVAGAALLSACEFEGGDPVQHALRDAAAARQATALKTTDEEEVEAIRRATASGPALHTPVERSRL